MNISPLSLFEIVIFQPFISPSVSFRPFKTEISGSNLQVVFGFTIELVNIRKAELNHFCVVIYGHSKGAVLGNWCALSVG